MLIFRGGWLNDFLKLENRGRILKKSGGPKRVVYRRTISPAVDRINKRHILTDQLENIYCLHRQGLFSVALSICGCRQLAEDAIQSAFEKLCRSAANPEGEIVNYVFATVRNTARDIVRSKRLAAKRTETIFAEFSAAGSFDEIPEDKILTTERHGILKTAVDELDEDDREVVVMKVYAELTFDAIGEILKQPGKTVATRYRRALLKLEERLRGQL